MPKATPKNNPAQPIETQTTKSPEPTSGSATRKAPDLSKVSAGELEPIAVRLESIAKEVEAMGEEMIVKAILNAAKSARWFGRQRTLRVKRVGGIVADLKAKGLSDTDIVAKLSNG